MSDLTLRTDDELGLIYESALDRQHFELAHEVRREEERRRKEIRLQQEEERQSLNNRNNVFSKVDHFKGWHLVSCRVWKRGVYRFEISRNSPLFGTSLIAGFARQALITTAIELGVLSRPNGRTMA